PRRRRSQTPLRPPTVARRPSALKNWPMTTRAAPSSRRFPTEASLPPIAASRSEEHTSELQSRENLVCRLLLEKKKTDRLPRTRCPLLLPHRSLYRDPAHPDLPSFPTRRSSDLSQKAPEPDASAAADRGTAAERPEELADDHAGGPVQQAVPHGGKLAADSRLKIGRAHV